jgi:HlyD family secretion protein
LQAVIEKAPTPPAGAGGDNSAATPAPSAPGEKPKEIKGVYVLDGNKVKFLQVETGITGESDIEIISGLKEGLEVITGPSRVLRTLKENATVKKQTRKPGEGEGKAGESK